MQVYLTLGVDVDEKKWAEDNRLNTERLPAKFVVPEDVKAAFVIALRNQFMRTAVDAGGAIHSIRRMD